MHVVCLWGARAAIRFLLGDEVVVLRVVHLEVVVASRLVVTKSAGDAEVLGASIKDDFDGLALRVAEINCALIQGVV